MKAIYAMRLAGCALIAAMSVGAWAQGSAPAGSDQSTMSQPQPQTKKEVRARNRALEKSVRKAFTHTKGLDATAITIKARQGGAVWLSGSVTDPNQINVAGDTAKGVSGVTSVKNDVTVKQVGQ